jgi:hypothetical protein
MHALKRSCSLLSLLAFQSGLRISVRAMRWSIARKGTGNDPCQPECRNRRKRSNSIVSVHTDDPRRARR